MLRKLITVLAAAAALAGLSIGAAQAAPAQSQHHRILIGEQFYAQNAQNDFWLHAHSNGGQMQDAASGAQQWFTQDAQSWTFNGVTYTGVEIELAGSGLCMTYDGAVPPEVILDGCGSGFGNGSQLWVVSHDYNTGGDWFLSVYASAHTSNHTWVYATDDGSLNHFINGEGSGHGYYAEWYDSCTNC